MLDCVGFVFFLVDCVQIGGDSDIRGLFRREITSILIDFIEIDIA